VARTGSRAWLAIVGLVLASCHSQPSDQRRVADQNGPQATAAEELRAGPRSGEFSACAKDAVSHQDRAVTDSSDVGVLPRRSTHAASGERESKGQA
jgi:hypothetical protein